jgi:hypothetical protein
MEIQWWCTKGEPLREHASAAAEAEGMNDRGDCQQWVAGIIRVRILFASRSNKVEE